MKNNFLIISLLACASFPAHAETIDGAISAALQKHPSVQAAMAGVDVAAQQRREEFSGYFPEVSVNANAGRLFGDNSTTRGLSVTRGEAYSYTAEGSINVRQMLFDGLETPNRVDAAQVRKMSAGADVVDIREQVGLRAAQAYINVVRARKALSMIEEHSARVDDYLKRISSMVDEGAADDSELQQARDIRVILNGIRADFEGQVIGSEAQYYEATGELPEDVLQTPAGVDGFLPSEMKDGASIALNNHPAILSSKLNSKAAHYDIRAEKGTLFPDFDGELSYLKSDKDDLIGGEAVDARALVRMSWNFSTGGAELARIKRTKFSHKQSMAQLKELERQIERDVRLAWSELDTSRKQLAFLQERRDLNAKLFKTYESQFEAARIGLLQLMQAHNQLFNTKLETMNGQYRYLNAQYGVLASMGQLQKAVGAASQNAQKADG